MLLAAEMLKGDEAHGLGLVQRLGGLDDALAWADDVAALAPAHPTGPQGPAGEPARRPRGVEAAWASDDLQEGLAAFRDHRRPVFHAR